MTHLTSAQVLAIALQCSSVDPDLIVSIAHARAGSIQPSSAPTETARAILV
jgi:hypothetical protein